MIDSTFSVGPGSVRLGEESVTRTCEEIDFADFALMSFEWVTL
jgi:hypothetical protein